MDGSVGRANMDGWRTAEGVYVFGGFSYEADDDLSDVRLWDNSWTNMGKYSIT